MHSYTDESMDCIRLKSFFHIFKLIICNAIGQGRNHVSKVWGSELGEARIEGTKRPRFECETRIRRTKPEKERGRGLGRGLGEPLPRMFL